MQNLNDMVERYERREIEKALRVAKVLAEGPQFAVQWTKRSLNHWVRQAIPIFESSLAYEMLNFFGDDVVEGAQALIDKREPKFPTAQS